MRGHWRNVKGIHLRGANNCMLAGAGLVVGTAFPRCVSVLGLMLEQFRVLGLCRGGSSVYWEASVCKKDVVSGLPYVARCALVSSSATPQIFCYRPTVVVYVVPFNDHGCRDYDISHIGESMVAIDKDKRITCLCGGGELSDVCSSWHAHRTCWGHKTGAEGGGAGRVTCFLRYCKSLLVSRLCSL